MDKGSRIKDLVQGIAGTDRKRYQFRLMEVVSVEGDLCRAKMENFEIPGIRLSPIINGSENGVLVTPSEGSIILVADISNGELRDLVAIAYTEIDSIRVHKGATTIYADDETVTIDIGESNIEVTDGLIQLNGGKNNGLINIDELTKKLNGLVGTVNDLISEYNGHNHICPAGGNTTGFVSTQKTKTSGESKESDDESPRVNNASTFNKADYENPKVTH